MPPLEPPGTTRVLPMLTIGSQNHHAPRVGNDRRDLRSGVHRGKVTNELDRKPPRSALPGLSAFELPRSETPMVKTVAVVFPCRPVMGELDLQLRHDSRHELAADDADRSAPWSADDAVRGSRRQLPGADRGAGFVSEDRFIGHAARTLCHLEKERQSPAISGRCASRTAPRNLDSTDG
jgi:hypothetical protein